MLAFRLHLLSTDAFHLPMSSHQYEYLISTTSSPPILFYASSPPNIASRIDMHFFLSCLYSVFYFSSWYPSYQSERARPRKISIYKRSRPSSFLRVIAHSLSTKTVNRKDQRMETSLTALVENIKSGAIEMRNPRADLSGMFRGRLKVYGWTIGLDVEPVRSAKTMSWLLKGHFLCSKVSNCDQSLAICAHFHFNLAVKLLLLSDRPTTLHLDTLPHSEIDSCITSFIKSLAVGSTATIDFAPDSLDEQGFHFMFSSLAYFYATPRLFRRCPLKDRADRITFIDQYGLDMWREQRFFMYWEAALLDVGHATRWIVELQK
ncbi:hypothetical protein ARMGADRAFT_1090753 [Armillaria gallica]|uniref:Uncharacterized protein n=1 Tax=Armillaria gallica TaxID=47427 RepID=A0A2H3CYN0_ARMGA|nr:hypothetical protein ARMGADRAFT_1090753 [Armillaria gallica]